MYILFSANVDIVITTDNTVLPTETLPFIVVIFKLNLEEARLTLHSVSIETIYNIKPTNTAQLRFLPTFSYLFWLPYFFFLCTDLPVLLFPLSFRFVTQPLFLSFFNYIVLPLFFSFFFLSPFLLNLVKMHLIIS